MRRVDRNRVPSYCSCGRSFRGPGPRANHGRLIGHSWIAAEEFRTPRELRRVPQVVADVLWDVLPLQDEISAASSIR